jgi:hypothetical protein
MLHIGATQMKDPTRDEMLALLATECEYADQYDRESAVFWFASDWHGGQGSNLYQALCNAPYRPGLIEDECPDDAAGECYEVLAAAYCDF